MGLPLVPLRQAVNRPGRLATDEAIGYGNKRQFEDQLTVILVEDRHPVAGGRYPGDLPVPERHGFKVRDLEGQPDADDGLDPPFQTGSDVLPGALHRPDRRPPNRPLVGIDQDVPNHPGWGVDDMLNLHQCSIPVFFDSGRSSKRGTRKRQTLQLHTAPQTRR